MRDPNQTTFPFAPETAAARQQIVTAQHNRVITDVRLMTIATLQNILSQLQSGRGEASYIPLDPGTSPGYFIANTAVGKASIQNTDSRLCINDWKLTESAVPLAPPTLQMFHDLIHDTNELLQQVNLRRLDYVRGLLADSIRDLATKNQTQPYQNVERWAACLLRGDPNWFLPDKRIYQVVSKNNLFTDICFYLEGLPQPESIVETVLQKLQEATLSLKVVTELSPAWQAAHTAWATALEAATEQAHRNPSPRPTALNQDLRSAEVHLTDVEDPALRHLQNAFELFIAARELAKKGR